MDGWGFIKGFLKGPGGRFYGFLVMCKARQGVWLLRPPCRLHASCGLPAYLPYRMGQFLPGAEAAFSHT